MSKRRMPNWLWITLWTLFVLVAVGTASKVFADERKPLQLIQDDLQNKFTPIAQGDDDELVNHSGEIPFSGDCDDYYSAAFNQAWVYGYEPFAIIAETKATGTRHIMACVKVDGFTRCLDNRFSNVLSMRDVRKSYDIQHTLTAP